MLDIALKEDIDVEVMTFLSNIFRQSFLGCQSSSSFIAEVVERFNEVTRLSFIRLLVFWTLDLDCGQGLTLDCGIV